jgi:hypothetical protein
LIPGTVAIGCGASRLPPQRAWGALRIPGYTVLAFEFRFFQEAAWAYDAETSTVFSKYEEG